MAGLSPGTAENKFPRKIVPRIMAALSSLFPRAVPSWKEITGASGASDQMDVPHTRVENETRQEISGLAKSALARLEYVPPALNHSDDSEIAEFEKDPVAIIAMKLVLLALCTESNRFSVVRAHRQVVVQFAPDCQKVKDVILPDRLYFRLVMAFINVVERNWLVNSLNELEGFVRIHWHSGRCSKACRVNLKFWPTDDSLSINASVYSDGYGTSNDRELSQT